MATLTEHVLDDRSEVHIQMPNMCKDNVLFKLPQCLNGLIILPAEVISSCVKLLDPAPLFTIRA